MLPFCNRLPNRQDNRRAYDTLRASLGRDSNALLADAREAIEEVRAWEGGGGGTEKSRCWASSVSTWRQASPKCHLIQLRMLLRIHSRNDVIPDAPRIAQVRRELRGQNTTAARLGTIESRLSSLEGSILSAGGSWVHAIVTGGAHGYGTQMWAAGA